MKFKLEYSPFVKRDIEEIRTWYLKIDKKLFSNFLKDFRTKIKYIKENPLSSELKYNKNRIVFLKNFSYGIHYQVDETEKIIRVFSIFHTSRNPEIWRENE